MSSLLSFVFFMLFMFLFIHVGLTATAQFIEYLRKHHAERFEAMAGKSFLGMPADNFWTPLIKPVVFLKFLVSPDWGDDVMLKKHIQRVRILLLAYVVLSFLAAMLVD